MKIKFSTRIFSLSVGCFLCSSVALSGQTYQEMNIQQTMEQALQNHQQLKVSSMSKEIAAQQTEIAKLQQLPNINASASAGYLGNVLFLDKNFSKLKTVELPHFANSYTVQASELLYKGGLVKKTIEVAQLREQLAELDWQKDAQTIKFLVASNYLDIYKLTHQAKVYENNRNLAQKRLDNVKMYYKQGVVTRNEVIRGELVLKNIEQAQLVVKNTIAILNYNLSVALGLPRDLVIIPTENITNALVIEEKEYYQDLAHQGHPLLHTAEKNAVLAQKNIDIINTDKYPSISAVGSYNMQRPYTTASPALDVYYNNWMTGISINYNLDNLYKTPQKLKLGKIQKTQAEEVKTLIQQNLDMEVNAAFIKYQEAVSNAEILMESQHLAQENYKIIEAKYLNQLAIQAEMTDATNAKLEAELQYANAQISILYQYYQLIKATGTL